jgi:hypothetical protein
MVWGIETASDFFEKLKEDHDEFVNDSASARLALNCVITAYHLAEWIWGDLLKGSFAKQRSICEGAIFREKKDYIDWLKARVPAFVLAEELTNGTKHFSRGQRSAKANQTQAIQSTSRRRGGYWGSAYFGMRYFPSGFWGPHPRLLVDLTDGTTVSAEDLISELIRHWEQSFARAKS